VYAEGEAEMTLPRKSCLKAIGLVCLIGLAVICLSFFFLGCATSPRLPGIEYTILGEPYRVNCSDRAVFCALTLRRLNLPAYIEWSRNDRGTHAQAYTIIDGVRYYVEAPFFYLKFSKMPDSWTIKMPDGVRPDSWVTLETLLQENYGIRVVNPDGR
jgi:hypothetical protein